ncbi:L-histidine N(alpha)-methyltransferase [Hoyosella sp. G463]|uniref:Histidine N-alpha-methyltransferase n=1 Tax=Lolliginicoccus lacisalsi TaxID=2742202 RepID=A0A927JDR8_9ACTN|nr:L-histidine N(alpha)-methyltransferase [Lolliginicoccus lacisalsi]MBD8506777.1 L-histidine N(alpha)-methyltransferase [Lolliginicoccus lacisalsi]
MVNSTQRLDVHLADDARAEALVADVRAGLAAQPRSLPPKWFYDATGSELFEQITRLPEYYPTRTEKALLADCAPEIASITGARTIVELGSGSSEKTRLLLDALDQAGTLATYVAQDVSPAALASAMAELEKDYPRLAVHGVVSDFSAGGFRDGLRFVPEYPDRMMVFLGGTIGTLDPIERAAFLAAMRESLHPGEHVLIGAGLILDEATMVAAYDDDAGVTAEFNRNVLAVMNRELGADFPVEEFEHVAVWDASAQWIEMRLRARSAIAVRIPGAGLDVDLAAGEEIRTEVSAKFDLLSLSAEMASQGLPVAHAWQDPDSRFALLLARVE